MLRRGGGGIEGGGLFLFFTGLNRGRGLNRGNTVIV